MGCPVLFTYHPMHLFHHFGSLKCFKCGLSSGKHYGDKCPEKGEAVEGNVLERCPYCGEKFCLEGEETREEHLTRCNSKNSAGKCDYAK